MKVISITCGLIIVLGLSACQTVNRGSFGEFMRSLNTTSYGYQVVDDPTGSAPTSMVERFEVQPGDCSAAYGWSDCKNDRERSELSERHKSWTRGTTKWYGWSFYVPEDFINIFPTKTVLGQFHQEGSHPVWLFQHANYGFFLDKQVFGRTRGFYKLIEENDLRGKWHRIEVHAKWTKKDDGFFKVWVNGEQKFDYSGQTMTATATYFKYGIYRAFLSRYKRLTGSDEVPGQIVYYANVRRASSREGIAAPMQ